MEAALRGPSEAMLLARLLLLHRTSGGFVPVPPSFAGDEALAAMLAVAGDRGAAFGVGRDKRHVPRAG